MNRAYDHRHYHCLMTIGIRIYLSQQFSLLIHEVTLVLTSRNKGHYHSTLSPVCLFSIISCWFYWFWNITGSVNYESFELWKISSGKNNLVLVFTDIYILFQTYKVNVVLSIIIIVIHHRHHFHWDNHHFDKKRNILTQESTVHGVRYFVDGENLYHRIVWIVIMGCSVREKFSFQ